MEDYITEITERLNTGDVSDTGMSQCSRNGSTLIHQHPSENSTLIFTKHDNLWTFQAKLVASDGAANSFFGISLSVSSDGNTALVGAPSKSSTGAAYVFTRSGSTWTQQQKLVASDGAASDWFGYRVSLSSDGNTALVGAPYKSAFTGAAYIFTRSGSTWTQQQKLVASDAAANDCFGISVSVSSDGNTALVGAHNKSSSTGAAYIFTRSGSTWTQQQKLVASDGAANHYFGCRCDLSEDGRVIKIRNTWNKEYTFTRVDNKWVEPTLSESKSNPAYDWNNLRAELPQPEFSTSYRMATALSVKDTKENKMVDPDFDPKFRPTEPTPARDANVVTTKLLTKTSPGWPSPSDQSQHHGSQPKDSELVNNQIASLKRQLHDARVALGKHEDFVKYNEQLIKSLESHIQMLVSYAELRQMETRF